MPSRKTKLFQDRLKTIRHSVINDHHEYDKSTLADRISEIKSRILECNNDLSGVFKNNSTIKLKRDNLLNELDMLENTRYTNSCNTS